MKWFISLLFFTGLAGGVWYAWPPSAPVTSAAAVTWELADIRELGQLRLLATEISSYQLVTTMDPARYLKAVIPVRIILGLDLSQAQVRREGATAVVTLPPVRILHKSSDPQRWNIWETHGVLKTADESISMAQLAELLAFKEADKETLRLGLDAKARVRGEAVIGAWLRGLGAPEVRFRP
jgi:hypothetical protein